MADGLMLRQTLALESAPVASAAASAETLAQAVARAVVSFPAVKTARANQRAAGESAAQARGAWFPTLDASLGQGTEHTDNATTRSLGATQVGGSTQTLPRQEAQVTFTQLLFDGGVTSGQVRRFQARAEGAQDQVAGAAEDAANRAAQAFLEVVRLRGLVRLAADNVSLHEQTLAQMTLLADSGRGRRADAQQADARLALAQSSLTQLRNQLVQGEASYRHMTGRNPPQLADPESFVGKLPDTINDALARAFAAHPGVRAAEKDLLATSADRESARSRVVAPRLALEAATTSNHDLDGVRGMNSDTYAMLRLRYNLFRGGIDDSRVREAEARYDEALANVGKARNDVERDLRQAWDALREDRARLPQLGRYVAATNEVVVSYRAQFMIGQRTLLDVLNSENELYNAKSSLFTALNAVTAGEIKVLAAMGKLLDTLGVALPADDANGKDEANAPQPENVMNGSNSTD